MKNKGIIIGGSLLVVGLLSFVVVKAATKKKTPAPKTTPPVKKTTLKTAPSGVRPATVAPDTSMGKLVDTNWNDNGGYYYLFPDGSQDYYTSDGRLDSSRDAEGNVTLTANYNSWDDNGGYVYTFSDGSQDYYRSNDTYVNSYDATGSLIS